MHTRTQRRMDLARQQRTSEVEKILQYDSHKEDGQGSFLVKFQGKLCFLVYAVACV
jgi:hypothetical protein